jgi:hypothetical protein
MDWVFDVLGWNEVIHSIAPDNIASQVVARNLGSSNRGPGQLPAPFESTRVDIWAQTQAQWSVQRAQWQQRLHPWHIVIPALVADRPQTVASHRTGDTSG